MTPLLACGAPTVISVLSGIGVYVKVKPEPRLDALSGWEGLAFAAAAIPGLPKAAVP